MDKSTDTIPPLSSFDPSKHIPADSFGANVLPWLIALADVLGIPKKEVLDTAKKHTTWLRVESLQGVEYAIDRSIVKDELLKILWCEHDEALKKMLLIDTEQSD